MKKTTDCIWFPHFFPQSHFSHPGSNLGYHLGSSPVSLWHVTTQLEAIIFKFSFFIFGCAESLLLRMSCLWLQRVGATLCLRCTGFSLQRLLSLRSMGSRHAGFSRCATWAWLPLGMWDRPNPGIETGIHTGSHALAGRFLSTGLQENPQVLFL